MCTSLQMCPWWSSCFGEAEACWNQGLGCVAAVTCMWLRSCWGQVEGTGVLICHPFLGCLQQGLHLPQ